MSTALYRRYRPDTFADVIGQEHVTEPLARALDSGRINHAYLFSGPRGCGKTTSARILARCLNCAQGPTSTPCGECDSCVALARGGAGSIDVIEIDAASHGGVDDARELRERAAFAPAESRFKVYIIDEAHMVTTQGFNALLKIVEEPPPHVKFVFATTEPEKVIGTIRSRTHHYPFRLVPPARLHDYLGELCAAEEVAVEPGVLSFVVRAGGGSVRDSLSVLDQLIAGSSERGLTYDGAAALLGFTDAELLDAVITAFAAGDAAEVFRRIEQVVETGLDPRRFVEDVLERFRDLIVLAAVPEAGASVLRGLASDQIDRMRVQAAAFGPGALSRAADVVNAGLTEMTGATSPRLQLELIAARVLLPGAAGERGYAARLDRLERRLDMGGVPSGVAPAAAAPPGGADAAPAPGAPAAAPTPPPAPSDDPPLDAAPHDQGPPRAAQTGRHGGAVPGAGRGGSAGRPPAAGSAEAAGQPGAPPPAGPPQPTGRGSAPLFVPAPAGAHRGPGDVPADAAAGPETSGVGADAVPGGAAPAGLDVAALRRSWPDVLAKIFTLKRTTWTFLSEHAQVVGYDGRTLVLGIATTGLANTFRAGVHADIVRQALIDVLGLDVRVDAVVGSGPPSGGTGPPDDPWAVPGPRPDGGAASAGRAAGMPPAADGHGVAGGRAAAGPAGGMPARGSSTGPAGAGAPAGAENESAGGRSVPGGPDARTGPELTGPPDAGPQHTGSAGPRDRGRRPRGAGAAGPAGAADGVPAAGDRAGARDATRHADRAALATVAAGDWSERGTGWGSAPVSGPPSWATGPGPAESPARPEAVTAAVGAEITAATDPPVAADPAPAPSAATGAAATGAAAPGAAATRGGPEPENEEDLVSDDDEDLLDLGEVGQPVVERLLGATVIWSENGEPG